VSAAYQRDAGGTYQAHAVLVLALSPTGIARVDIFLEPGLFGRFGLPEVAAARFGSALLGRLSVRLACWAS
jgi:hypothetical protein